MKKCVGLLACLFILAVLAAPDLSIAQTSGIEVGRVYHIEGDVQRYVPEEKDWVAVVRDVPFGTGDTFFASDQGRAEFIVPNGSWIRTGSSTQIEFMALDTDVTEIDVAAGVARFYNKGDKAIIKATSPFGYVLAYPGTVFDFYVGENSVEVVAVKGTVTFVHAATETQYDVSAGSPSILADQNQVSSGDGGVDSDWDRWNKGREDFWAAKAMVRGPSVEYLPPSLRYDAYTFEENGRWESVPYEGANRWFWTPVVAPGWSPFTVGRWTDWYGDQTWIPAEPFGYVTHHYGNWVYVRGRWYWAPPVVAVRVGMPFLNVGFFFNPGRVSWIYSGAYVGWVPLAYGETYYSHRYWGGPHNVAVTNITQININIRNYAYANRAIIVNRDHFYDVNSYRNVRITNVTPGAMSRYHAAPIINNTVIGSYTTNRARYNYTNTATMEKPHNAVVNRIRDNEMTVQRGKKETAPELERQARSMRQGTPARDVRVEEPKITNYMVRPAEVNRPKSEMKFQQIKIKGALNPRPSATIPQVVIPQHVAPAAPGQSKQVVIPQHIAPARPETPNQIMVPEHVAPARPGQIGQVVVPEHAAPAKANQPDRPGQAVVPQYTAPAAPGQSKQVTIPEHVAPAKPPQKDKAQDEAGRLDKPK